MYYNLNVVIIGYKSQILGPDPNDPTKAIEYQNTDAPNETEWSSTFIPTVHFDPSRYPSLVVDDAPTYKVPVSDLPIVFPFAKNLQQKFVPVTKFLKMTFNTHAELENFTQDLVEAPEEFLVVMGATLPTRTLDYITYRFQETDPTEVP